MITEPATTASPKNWSEMKILGPTQNYQIRNSIGGYYSSLYLSKLSGWFSCIIKFENQPPDYCTTATPSMIIAIYQQVAVFTMYFRFFVIIGIKNLGMAPGQVVSYWGSPLI